MFHRQWAFMCKIPFKATNRGGGVIVIFQDVRESRLLIKDGERWRHHVACFL